MLIKLILIFLGGGLGSCARFLIGYLNPNMIKTIPIATLIANGLASFVLGIYFYNFKTNPNETWIKYFIMLGFCGGLTAFSPFSGELMEYIWNHQFWHFFIYIILSISCCLICFYFGFEIKRTLN